MLIKNKIVTLYMHILFFLFIWSFSPDNFDINNPMVQQEQLDSIFSSNKLRLDDYKQFTIRGADYFLNQSSGILYQLDQGILVRIDESYDDKIHNHSLDFVHKDTLFRFGGYGYFHAHKNLVYFDFPTKQWDMVRFTGHEQIDGFSFGGVHFFSGDKLYVIGYTSHAATFQNESTFIRKGFVFDFKTRRIEAVFELDQNFYFPTNYIQVNNRKVFLFYPQERKLLILDTGDLTFQKYTLNQVEGSLRKYTNRQLRLVDNILMFPFPKVNGEQDIAVMDVKNVIENSIPTEGTLIRQTPYYWAWAIVGILVIVAALFYGLNKKKKKISFTDKHLFYGKDKLEIDPKMKLIIELLMEGDTLKNSELNELFFRKGLNPIHINREKNLCIDKLNFLFKTKFNKEFVIKSKSVFDKRMIIYFLNPDL